ncbi:porin [Scytonema hofmannii PCC 7110]|uniref:Porin n=1 Tax=Scytonema hofmannii PCC 7110 TaxID=128403 RepID=A0A139X374_9CYAN|nr:iron uptake porin [Scytonema hofmannii]KYC39110.1 porin [Scytonema hofmannii PCC 7110]
MSKVIQNALYVGSTTLGIILVLTNSTLGADFSRSTMGKNESAIVMGQSTPYLENNDCYIPNTLTQVTSVSQLSDIKNTDWSFQALKSLIKRYGVVVNDFDNLFWGNQSIARYEFAALLKAAVDRLNELTAKKNANLVRQKDVCMIQRLQSEFRTELATWQRRADNLEVKTSQLAAQRFSPTAKLTGEVIFALSGARGNEKADDDDEKVDENLILSDRVWLNFDMSFTGRDRLFVRLEAENTPGFDDATGTEMARLGFEGDSNNKFDINQLEYRFSLSEAAKLYITTDSTDIRRVANTSSFSSSGRGAISRFGRYSPLYRQDFGAVVRLKYEFSNAASLSLGFGDDNAEELDDDSESVLDEETDGVVVQLALESDDDIQLILAYLQDDDKYAAIAQLILEPINRVKIGLTYLRSYNNLDTSTGSELANDPFDDESNYIITNSYGIETSIQVSSDFTIAGWVGLTEAKATDLLGKPEATIFHYAVTLAFSDLGKEDSLAGIVIGQPPKVTSNDWGTNYTDKDTSLHLEFFYRFQATDNIAITPGLLIVTNPEHNRNNDTIYVGTFRTTFRF